MLFSRAARTICDRIYKDSKYDWNVVLENYRTKINSFILSNDSEEKKKARILNFLSQMYPINVNDSRLIESISLCGIILYGHWLNGRASPFISA